MKKLDNIRVNLPLERLDGAGNIQKFLKPTCYALLIEDCIKNRPPAGFDADTIEGILRVKKVLKPNCDYYEFEDSDIKFIKAKVEVMLWAIAEQEIMDFINYIHNL